MDEEIDFPVLVGQTYAIVAFADGNAAHAEKVVFLQEVENIFSADLEGKSLATNSFDNTILSLKTNYALHSERIMFDIQKACETTKYKAILKRLIGEAVIADHKITPQEELVVDRIARACGMRPGRL